MSHTTWLQSQKQPPIPENEKERLQALYQYMESGADAKRDEPLQKLTRLAAEICDVPIALVNLIDEKDQITKACFGFEQGKTPREKSVCQYTIMQENIFEIKDTLEDPFFRNHPFAKSELNLRYYAGAQLKTPDGNNIGTLCLVDYKPNSLTESQKKALRTLADEIISRFELVLVNRKLEKMIQEKGNLLRIVSHDMRNPLMGIIGFSEYLSQETDDEEKKEIFSIMEDAGKHLLGIVNVLLGSEYVKSDSFSMNRKVVDVAESARNMVVLYEPSSRIKNQTFESDFPDSLKFKVDQERWKDIVGNLIGNAVKFTPKNGKISMKLELSGDDVPKLIFRIRDSGVGMSPEQLASLYTGKSSIRREGTEGEESFGLGMPLIKKSVELHRGRIRVDSEVGKGTQFEIEIPG